MSVVPQPDLRSFIVYSAPPAGCFTFEVPDDTSVPHLRAGEFVVVDPADREPAEGELFVITWKSSFDRKAEIVQMYLRKGRFGFPDGVRDAWLWYVGAPAPRELTTLAGQPVGLARRWVDGPYHDDYLRDISHGKIVGIVEPDFRRQIAAVPA
jgi:hypothetical protein